MKTYFSDVLKVLSVFFIERALYILWMLFVPGPGMDSRLPVRSVYESFVWYLFWPLYALIWSLIAIPIGLLLLRFFTRREFSEDRKFLYALIIYIILLHGTVYLTRYNWHGWFI